MRYIIAETASSADEALGQLNQVRLARTVTALPLTAENLDRTFIQNEITKEYQKEMYAEGQLFYYYKRRNFTDIPFKPAGMTSFSTKNYLLPIPKDELEFNPNY
ncbi:SusD family protein [compost metagenome]